MAGSWTYDFNDPQDKDTVRLLIGDTVESFPLVFDEEIEMALTLSGGGVYDSAGLVARMLAARYARVPDITVGGKSVKGSVLADRYTTLAAQLEGQAASGAVPLYAAGLRWSEVIADAQDIDLRKAPFDDVEDRSLFVPTELELW